MELLTHKDDHAEYTYYLWENGGIVYHGEFKDYFSGGQKWEHSFYYNGQRHGEYKAWTFAGELVYHCFYINGKRIPYVEMNNQEKLLFQIQNPGFRFIEE